MSRLSKHLPQFGALVLAAVVAVVAYSVHEGQSTGSSPDSTARASLGLGGSPLPSVSKPESSADTGDRSSPPGAAPTRSALRLWSGTRSPDSSGAAHTYLTASSPPSTPRRRGAPPHSGTHPPDRAEQPGGGHHLDVDRELRRLLDEPPPTRRPQRPPPRTGVPPGAVSPAEGRLVDGVPPEPPPAAPDPGAVSDPDAGLDDTAVGGLDQTDLGEPLDEADNPTGVPAPPAPGPTSTPAPPAPALAPEAPPATANPATSPAAGIAPA
jgi:hypothetical protein